MNNSNIKKQNTHTNVSNNNNNNNINSQNTQNNKINHNDDIDEEEEFKQHRKSNNIRAGGLLQPLINQSQYDSVDNDYDPSLQISRSAIEQQQYQQQQQQLQLQKQQSQQQQLQQQSLQIEEIQLGLTRTQQQQQGQLKPPLNSNIRQSNVNQNNKLRESDIQIRKVQRRRENKQGAVCFNKRQIYLKNMKIYNALYNFTPPNQKLNNEEEGSLLSKLGKIIPVFEPSNRYLLFWEFAIFLLTCLIFYLIPIELFFQINLIPTSGYGMALRVIFFLFFVFDILLYLNIGFFSKGKLINDRKEIFKNYLKNNLNGKPITHIIGLMGIILNLFTSDKSNLGVIDYFCLLFYIRLINLNEFDTVIIQQLQLNRKSKCAYQLLRLGMVIFFISNFFACIFYRVGVIEQEILGRSWLQTISEKLPEWYVPNMLIYYLYSLYWSVTTMISVGYGDVTPVAPYEVLVTIICMMCSCILFAYSINSIWFIISEVSMGAKRYEQNMNAINRFMRDKQINAKLKKKIQAYLDFHWKDSISREKDKENQIIQSLPQNLKLELIYEANSFFFQQFEWSKHFSFGFLQLLSQFISEKKYLEDDILYEEGEDQDDTLFYYIDEGEVQLYYDLQFYNNGLGIPIQTVQSKNFVGLYEFFSGEKRHESARCLEMTNVYSISRKDFLEVVKNFPQDHQMYITLKDQMVYQKNYKLFGLKCFLCEKDDHLSHQCVEVQLKKDMMRKNQERLHPEIDFSSDSNSDNNDDEDNNNGGNPNGDNGNNNSNNNNGIQQINNYNTSNDNMQQLSKRHSQTINFFQQSNNLDKNDKSKQDIRLKYDVQPLKKSSHNKYYQSNQRHLHHYKSSHINDIVQSSQFENSNHLNRSQKQQQSNKSPNSLDLKPASLLSQQQLSSQLQSNNINSLQNNNNNSLQQQQQPKYQLIDTDEYVLYTDDIGRKTEDNLRRSRRHSSLVDIAHRHYDNHHNHHQHANKFIKSQAELPQQQSSGQLPGLKQPSHSQEINFLNSMGDLPPINNKKNGNLWSIEKSFNKQSEKVNLNQLGLDREKKKQLEKQQKERLQKEEENRISQTKQNIVLSRKLQNNLSLYQSQTNNPLLSSTNSYSSKNIQLQPSQSMQQLQLQQQLHQQQKMQQSQQFKQQMQQSQQLLQGNNNNNKNNKDSLKQQQSLQELSLFNQTTSLDNDIIMQRDDSKQIQTSELKGLLAQIVSKMANEGNIISENTLEYSQSIISRKNDNEEDDIDVPPIENNSDLDYVFYKYCRINQF